MFKILAHAEFLLARRESLLAHKYCHHEISDLAMRIPKVSMRLADKEWISNKNNAEVMRMARGRSEYAVDFLMLSYSVGVSIDELKDFYPSILLSFDPRVFKRICEVCKSH